MSKKIDLVSLVCTGCSSQLPPLNAQKQTVCQSCGNHFVLASGTDDEGDQQFSYLPLDLTSKISVPLKLRIAKAIQVLPNFLVSDDCWPSNYSIVCDGEVVTAEHEHSITADKDPLCVSLGFVNKIQRTSTSFWSRTTKVVETIEEAYANDAFKIYVLPVTDNKGRLVGHRVEISLYDETYRTQAETVIDLISSSFGVTPTAYLHML